MYVYMPFRFFFFLWNVLIAPGLYTLYGDGDGDGYGYGYGYDDDDTVASNKHQTSNIKHQTSKRGSSKGIYTTVLKVSCPIIGIVE